MTRVTRILCSLAVLLALAAPAAGQGALAPIGITQFNAAGTAPCNGCVITSFASGTTTPLATYADASLSTSNGTSVTLDAAGRAIIYLDSRLSYKLVLRTSGGTEIWTRDGIVGQLSGVITAQAANTRGIQVSRTSADAGISIQSSGGSGKTYGLVSNTSGGFRIQDDSDSTPRLEWLADNITATLTGTFSIPTGLFSAGGFGSHEFTSGGTGTQRLTVRNTTSGTGNMASVDVGNNSTATLGRFVALSSAFTPSSYSLASGVVLEGNGVGGISVAASDASGDVRVYAGGSGTARLTVDDTGLTTVTNLQATIQKSGSAQPGFLAYNNASDTVATGATVDFDTEVFDTASNFGTDQFIAPQNGIYHFCANVTYSDNAASEFTVSINTPAVLYVVYHALAETAGGGGGCIYASLTTGEGVVVVINTTDANATIEGVTGSYRQTWFSGRLVP